MFGRTRGGDDGWVEDEMQDGTRFRYRIGLDRISQIEPEVLEKWSEYTAPQRD